MTLLPLHKAPHEARVVVAMSGGVDSSTVAGLIAEAGYETIGITLQLYDHGEALQKKGACCAGQDIYDAKQVAERLGIAHYVLNYENVFKQDVIENFADSYIRGETPIPCVRCNQSVKFRDLLAVAKDLDADALVTGHYIQRIEGISGPELHRGADHGKDQSYFLFATTPEQLAYLHFPLGAMSKAETRQHAARFGLEVADKPESQDICFVPSGNYAKVIEKLRPEAFEMGDLVHMDGRTLGTHAGIAHFTVGQSKGLGLSHHEKLYVIKIDAETRRVLVGPKEALDITEFTLKDINWLGNMPLNETERDVTVKLRSVHQPVPARISMDRQGTCRVELLAAQSAVTPGQACVFYDGERVLGGGWITREHQLQVKIAA